MWQHFVMLFTPKTHGKDWLRFLGLSFCAASFAFAVFAILAPWTDYGALLNRLFAMLAFTAAAILSAALGRDQLKKASEL